MTTDNSVIDLAEIESRAKREDEHELWRHTTIERHLQAHADRAALLSHIKRTEASMEEMRGALEWIAQIADDQLSDEKIHTVEDEGAFTIDRIRDRAKDEPCLSA